MKALIFSIATLLLLVNRQKETKTLDCSIVKNGTFYYYPSKSHKSYKLIRKDSAQMEIDLKAKDTSFWKIKWIDQCVCKERFISTTGHYPQEFLDFLDKHTGYMTIFNVTDQYYEIKISLDSLTSVQSAQDTVWLNPK